MRAKSLLFADFCLNLQLKNKKDSIMKRIFSPGILLLSAMLLLASCLNSDDDDITYYSDTAISSFTLGTLNRYMHTLSSAGEDSIYTTTVTGSKYSFYIDQARKEIYNPDSLPCGTDNKHVICNISSKNSGIVVIKNVDSDTLKYYSSSDSIDFSTPREVRVYANDITGNYRAYTVRVNVHQEEADSFKWNALAANGGIGRFKKLKAVSNNGKIYVFGTDGTQTNIYYTDAAGNNPWTLAGSNLNMPFDADAYANAVAKDGYIYIMCKDGQIFRATDAQEWESVAQTGLKKLVGASSTKLYGLGGNGFMASADNGKTWTAELSDDNANQLPDEDISFCNIPLQTNDQTDRLIVAGNRSGAEYTADSTAVIWSKIEEYAQNPANHQWAYYDIADDNKYLLPRLEGLSILSYDGKLLAMGGKGLGTSTAKAYSQIYVSRDNGITWHSDSSYHFPKGFNRSATAITVVADSDNHLWIICGGTGEVWRGRLNKLGWKTHETSFTE